MSYAFVLVVGLAAGALSGIVGTGSSIVIIGASVMAGTFAGKLVVHRMSGQSFQHVLDAMLFCSGLSLLWGAFA